MADVNWRQDALKDLDETIRYIRQFDPEAALNMGARLFDPGASLVHFPWRGRPAPNGTRELVTVPPYILAYTVEGDTVHVPSIRRGARRPQE